MEGMRTGKPVVGAVDGGWGAGIVTEGRRLGGGKGGARGQEKMALLRAAT